MPKVKSNSSLLKKLKKSSAPKHNPFELKATRPKHQSVGERIRGVRGRPGESRQRGLDKRSSTILVEMQTRNKAGGLVDKRFGEGSIKTVEEKMQERYTRELQVILNLILICRNAIKAISTI